MSERISLKLLKQENACDSGRKTFKHLVERIGVKNPTADQLFIEAMSEVEHGDIVVNHILWGIDRFGKKLSRSSVEQIRWKYKDGYTHHRIMVKLVERQPALVKCFDIEQIRQESWIRMVNINPRLLKIRGVRKFSGYNQAEFIKSNPRLIKHVDLNKLTVAGWVEIIDWHPSLIKYCTVLKTFKKHQVERLVLEHGGKISKYFHINQIYERNISLIKERYPRIKFKNECK